MMNITKQQLKTPYLTAVNSLSGTNEAIAEKRAELKAYFINSWQTYESLFALINNDAAFYSRPEPLRHPLIFYFGHTATFYINKLMLGKFIKHRINEKLEAICAVGVDEMSWDDLNSEHYDWPSVEEVKEYRTQVFDVVCELIDTMELTLPISQDSLAWIILMGCEHERIHLETSSVIMRMLPLDDLTPTEAWQACPYQDNAPDNELLPIAGQSIELGKKTDDCTYGWDNEYGAVTLAVPDFHTSKYLVSNQEFMAFVEAGGYQKPSYWSAEGQQWLDYKKATMPRFWVKKDDGYYQRNLLSEIPLPLNWPVEVNYLEAKAFCNWQSQVTGRNVRLPTEPEWYVLRQNVAGDLPDWQEAPGNTNLEFFASSCPVDKFDNQGIFDVVGNVWQWTESSIDAFEGFKVHPLYDDFSTPTFDGKHNLIKGGSWISTGNEAIASSRYAFRRHFFQHAGFRYVQSEQQAMPLVPTNHFEQNQDVCQQLQSHYQAVGLNGGNYQQQLAEQVRTWLDEHQANTEKLLDLGCSVGRTSFELADLFEHIDGVDFSARYIQHGVKLQQGETVRFETVQEGDIVDFHELGLADLALSAAQNVLFSQGDATNLKAIFTGYDVVLAQQVLEQCYDPKQFLKQVSARLNDGALLIIASDYQFDTQVAPKEKWLGGIKVNGENLVGFEGVRQTLGSQFELLAQAELNQVIKVTKRTSQLSEKHLTLWRFKA